jgi:hypothetical protein
VVQGIADENTPGGMKSKLIRSCREQVGVAGTPKDLEMPVGRLCIVEDGVKT